MNDEIDKDVETASGSQTPDDQSKPGLNLGHRLGSRLKEFAFSVKVPPVKVPFDFSRLLHWRHFSFVHERKENAASRLRFYAFVLLLASLTYLVAVPFLHDYLVETWKLLPVGLAAALFTALAILQIKVFERHRLSLRLLLMGANVLCGVVLVGYLFFANTTGWYIESAMAASLKPAVWKELPETENLRILGQGTAGWYLHSRNLDNRQDAVGLPQLVRECSGDTCELWWQSAYSFKRGRIGSWLPRVLGSTQSILRVSASELETAGGATAGADTHFLFGQESVITELLFRFHHPISERAEATYHHNTDDSWSLLIPYITRRPTITGVMVPALGGVMEVSQNGWVRDHSVADATRLFPGSVLYPSVLARSYGEAYGHYRTGLVNVFVNESGIYQISEDPARPGENEQPYVQGFKALGEGSPLQEVIAFEPAGKQSFGLSELLFFDAQTGKAHVYSVPPTAGLHGPRRALKQATNADPETDWNAYSIQEPRLVVRPALAGSDGQQRFWLMTEVKNEGEDHTAVRLILTDMVTLKTKGFDSRAAMEHYLQGS
ncbi:MAG: hypothetical protein SFV17_03415 [Candidatus Obscuribacter sp.]|nr:hypothetical protein [Candidatus Obscuribacter sp.]